MSEKDRYKGKVEGSDVLRIGYSTVLLRSSFQRRGKEHGLLLSVSPFLGLSFVPYKFMRSHALHPTSTFKLYLLRAVARLFETLCLRLLPFFVALECQRLPCSLISSQQAHSTNETFLSLRGKAARVRIDNFIKRRSNSLVVGKDRVKYQLIGGTVVCE